MSDTSHFTYIPAGALASRRIIEESSYTTTPTQSSQDKTPPCGEATYKNSIGIKETEAINAALRNRTNAEAVEDQAAGGCEFSPDENNDQLHMKVKGGEGKAKGFPMCKTQDFRTEDKIWVSGDTIYLEELVEMKKKFHIVMAVVNLGAAKVVYPGESEALQITMGGNDAARLVRTIGVHIIVPVHYESWGHFTEFGLELREVFAEEGLLDRVCWVDMGKKKQIVWIDDYLQ